MTSKIRRGWVLSRQSGHWTEVKKFAIGKSGISPKVIVKKVMPNQCEGRHTFVRFNTFLGLDEVKVKIFLNAKDQEALFSCHQGPML
jgi:hypothetical protein